MFVGFKLCEECSGEEHDRASAIARTHKPILISEMNSNSTSDITCSKHGLKADLYDPDANVVLCQHCTSSILQDDSLNRNKLEPLSDALKVIPLVQYGLFHRQFDYPTTYYFNVETQGKVPLPSAETEHLLHACAEGETRDAEHPG